MPAADHSCVRSGSNDKNEYRPRNPQDSLLYRTIAAHLETFLARQQERGREVAQFVERDVRAYLSCGVLACGFLRLKCESCGKERLLPLSCKGRSVCPSCCGRRMTDTAAHLMDSVFPHVPARQWVLSVPFALRYRLAYDAEMVTRGIGRLYPGSLRPVPPHGSGLRHRPKPVRRRHVRAEIWVGGQSAPPFPCNLHGRRLRAGPRRKAGVLCLTASGER